MRKAMKTIPNFPNYAITKDGRVWSKPRKSSCGRKLKGQWLKPGTDSSGYFFVLLRRNSQSYMRRIHRLVLETFVGLCPKGMECRHLNSKPADNRFSNLCWDTHKNNLADRKLAENPQLIEQDIPMMKQMWRMGLYTQREIAKIYGVKPSTLWHWLCGERKRYLIRKKREMEQKNKNYNKNRSWLCGEELPGSKLTDNKVRVIRYLRYIAGFTLRDLAWQFNVGISNISCICSGQSWRHI